MIGKAVKGNKVDIKIWSVEATDCEAEYGKFTTQDMDRTFLYENDFAFGSDQVVSILAETICVEGAVEIDKELSREGYSWERPVDQNSVSWP